MSSARPQIKILRARCRMYLLGTQLALQTSSVRESEGQMKSSVLSIGLLLALQGCATSPQQTAGVTTRSTDASEPKVCRAADGIACVHAGTNTSSPAMVHLTTADTAKASSIHGSRISSASSGPLLEGKPLTSVVVTQCNLVVAVYMTMPDGRLLRFDQRAEIPAEDLVAVAYTANSSERVEVACEGIGADGFETHKPI
jgi:hypothetical protein